MRSKRNIFVAVLLVVIFAFSAVLSYAGYRQTVSGQLTGSAGNILVVTSFYPIYIAAENILDGVDGVTLENLSQPNTGCLHDYEPTSADMKLLSTADVFIVNGGGMETFLTDTASQYPDLTIIDTSQGIDALEEDGEANPHYWMSVSRYETQLNNIAYGMKNYLSQNAAKTADMSTDLKRESSRAKTAVMTASKSEFKGENTVYVKTGSDNEFNSNTLEDRSKKIDENLQDYLERLKQLTNKEQEVKKELKAKNITSVIILQEAYEYLLDDLGLKTAALCDLDEERQVSAKEIADLENAVTALKSSNTKLNSKSASLKKLESESVSVKYLDSKSASGKRNKYALVFSDNLYGKKIAALLKKEAGSTTVNIDPMTRPAADNSTDNADNNNEYPKDAYITGMLTNLQHILSALDGN